MHSQSWSTEVKASPYLTSISEGYEKLAAPSKGEHPENGKTLGFSMCNHDNYIEFRNG